MTNGFAKGYKMFGENIAIVVNSILFSVVYFLGFGATSIISKIFKKHFLDLDFDKESSTYWENFDLGKKEMGEYYRQF
ncbi:MAG: hypothetical protein PHQ66_00835 [Candidatus Nanoarchaeia archaeon]|nr:hypothetical protein [Candidatus Nanoarchaeia archaeon]MDD5358477.1 hypothetical protein [Candidatus Nanoarchaeia archaeon]MDD5588991.1 hypothetical protein [Candidatus Nanoarchaeia archaeon]